MSRRTMANQASDPSRLRPLWRNWDFQLLFAGSLTSVIGSEVSAIAYPLLVLTVTGSPAQAGLVAFAETAASVLFGLPSGALVDRWNKRTVMVVSDALRLVVTASIPVALAADRLTLAQIVLASAVVGGGRAFFYPARLVAVRRTVPAAQLPAALSQDQARTATASLVGPPLGGALFAAGRAVPFLTDALSFGVSLLCALGVRTPLRVDPGAATDRPGLWADIAEGLRWIWARRHFRAMMLYATAVNLAGGALLLPTIVLARADGATPTAIGLVLAGASVGMLAGSLVAARLMRLLPQHWLMALVGTIASVCVPAMAIPLGLAWLGGMLALVMLFTPAIGVAVNLTMVRDVPERLQGRVTSGFILLTGAAAPLGPLVAGLLLEYLSGSLTMVLLGGYLLLVTVATVLSPKFRAPDPVDEGADAAASSGAVVPPANPAD